MNGAMAQRLIFVVLDGLRSLAIKPFAEQPDRHACWKRKTEICASARFATAPLAAIRTLSERGRWPSASPRSRPTADLGYGGSPSDPFAMQRW